MLKEVLFSHNLKGFTDQLEREYGYTHLKHTHVTNMIQGVGYGKQQAKKFLENVSLSHTGDGFMEEPGLRLETVERLGFPQDLQGDPTGNRECGEGRRLANSPASL